MRSLDVTANNDSGIQTRGGASSSGGAGNDLEIQLTNRATNQATTTDGTLTTLITFPLGTTPGVYIFEGNVVAFNTTDNAGGVYGYVASARTDGITGVEIGSESSIIQEEAAMADAEIFATVSGNNLLLQVQWTGTPAAKNISWNGLLTYRLQT